MRNILLVLGLLAVVAISGLVEWQDHVNERTGQDFCVTKPRSCE